MALASKSWVRTGETGAWGSAPTRCQDPHAESTPTAAIASATRRLTCPTRNPGIVSRIPMPSENLTGRIIAGYHLLERVGEGGTAEVYRAQHPDRGPCAFKVLRPRLQSDPNAVTRFLREAGYGARVQHPGVVRTYDFGEAEGQQYLALEWAAGKSLAALVQRAGRLAASLVSVLVRQLGDALSATHRVGIIHRDLKPENIMYDEATE